MRNSNPLRFSQDRRQCRVSVTSATSGTLVEVEKEGAFPLPVPALSTIEEQVVLLVAGGRSHREIAGELGLSLKTVEWHSARARRKLEHVAALHDRVQEAGDPPSSQPQQRSER